MADIRTLRTIGLGMRTQVIHFKYAVHLQQEKLVCTAHATFRQWMRYICYLYARCASHIIWKVSKVRAYGCILRTFHMKLIRNCECDTHKGDRVLRKKVEWKYFVQKYFIQNKHIVVCSLSGWMDGGADRDDDLQRGQPSDRPQNESIV